MGKPLTKFTPLADKNLRRISCALLLLCAVTVKAQPINDNFPNRIVIVGGGETISGTLSNATFETGEPFLPGISSGQTAWWTWTAPSNGIVTLSVTPHGFSPLLTVYVGPDLESLSLIASNTYLACYQSGACGCHWRERNQIAFHVVRGQAYHIAADSAIVNDAVPGQSPLTGFPTNIWLMPTNLLDLINSALAQAGTNGWLTNIAWPTNIMDLIVGGSAQIYRNSLASPNVVIPWSYSAPMAPGPPTFSVFGLATTATQTTNIPAGGDLQLGFQFTPAPTNDDFESRVTLTGSRKQVTASNSGATKQSGELDHLGNPGGSSVWYSWKAPVSGRVSLSTNNIPPYLPPTWTDVGVVSIITLWPPTPTCGRDIDQNPPPPFYPVFSAYIGTNLNSLVLASNCLPMNVNAYPNAVEFDAIKGQIYQIAFDGNMGTTGTIPLFLAVTTPASNDNFNNRIKLHGINVAATGFNAGATHEAGEPFVSGSYGKSVWWSWTAPVTGIVSIDLGGSDHSFPVGVFVGTSMANLNFIATGSGSVSFDAVQGQTYQLSVNDASGLSGAIKLKLQAPVVGLPLARMLVRSADAALLSFTSSPHQVVLLQSSNDGSTWKDVSTAMARQPTVNFLAKPAPTDNGPFYRAIVVDYK